MQYRQVRYIFDYLQKVSAKCSVLHLVFYTLGTRVMRDTASVGVLLVQSPACEAWLAGSIPVTSTEL